MGRGVEQHVVHRQGASRRRGGDGGLRRGDAPLARAVPALGRRSRSCSIIPSSSLTRGRQRTRPGGPLPDVGAVGPPAQGRSGRRRSRGANRRPRAEIGGRIRRHVLERREVRDPRAAGRGAVRTCPTTKHRPRIRPRRMRCSRDGAERRRRQPDQHPDGGHERERADDRACRSRAASPVTAHRGRRTSPLRGPAIDERPAERDHEVTGREWARDTGVASTCSACVDVSSPRMPQRRLDRETGGDEGRGSGTTSRGTARRACPWPCAAMMSVSDLLSLTNSLIESVIQPYATARSKQTRWSSR